MAGRPFHAVWYSNLLLAFPMARQLRRNAFHLLLLLLGVCRAAGSSGNYFLQDVQQQPLPGDPWAAEPSALDPSFLSSKEPASSSSAGTPPSTLERLSKVEADLAAIPSSGVTAKTKPSSSLDTERATVARLQARLATAENAVVTLSAENEQLRNQLNEWHRVGRNMALRDARISKLLSESTTSKAAAPQTPPSGAAASKSSLIQAAQTAPPVVSPPDAWEDAARPRSRAALAQVEKSRREANAEREAESRMQRVRSYSIYTSWCAVLVAFAYFLYLMRDNLFASSLFYTSPARAKDRKVVRSMGGSANSLGQKLARASGAASYRVEVSELQVLNPAGLAPFAGEVRMAIVSASGEEAHSQPATAAAAAQGGASSHLSFPDSFQVSVGWLDGPCVIKVFDHGVSAVEPVAVTEIPAQQFLKMAQQRTEYFRLPLVSAATSLRGWACRRSSSSQETAEPASVAFRIQDCTGHYMLCATAGAVPRYSSC